MFAVIYRHLLQKLRFVKFDTPNFLAPRFPRSCCKRIRFGCKSTNRANINNVSGQFRFKHLLHVGSNLHIVTTTSGAKFRHASNFISKPRKQTITFCQVASLKMLTSSVNTDINIYKHLLIIIIITLPDASCTLYASRHNGLYKRTDIFIFDSSLLFEKATSISPEHHGLVLKIRKYNEPFYSFFTMFPKLQHIRQHERACINLRRYDHSTRWSAASVKNVTESTKTPFTGRCSILNFRYFLN